MMSNYMSDAFPNFILMLRLHQKLHADDDINLFPYMINSAEFYNLQSFFLMTQTGYPMFFLCNGIPLLVFDKSIDDEMILDYLSSLKKGKVWSELTANINELATLFVEDDE